MEERRQARKITIPLPDETKLNNCNFSTQLSKTSDVEPDVIDILNLSNSSHKAIYYFLVLLHHYRNLFYLMNHYESKKHLGKQVSMLVGI